MAPSATGSRCRIVVLASGSGTNLQALIDHEADSWTVAAVISDRPNARALDRAAAASIPRRIVAWRDHDDRASFTSALCAAVAEFEPDLIVLAGFMRILGAEAITRYPSRIINLHPSLLPAFVGAHAVRDALDHGVKVTGVTVHFVDEQLDHGPIIRQEPVAVLPGDDADSLHARIQQVEHRLLPEVVSELAAQLRPVAGQDIVSA